MRYLVLALLAVAFNANATYCTNGALQSSYPKCNVYPQPAIPTPSPITQSQAQQQNQAATANASAGANAGATSQSKAEGGNSQSVATGGRSVATGGNSGSDVSSSLGNIGNSNDNSSTKFSALALALPAPVYTPPLPAVNCPQANVEQKAGAAGWNFISGATASVNTDNCTAIILYTAYKDQCKFASAMVVLDSLTLKVLPGAKLPERNLPDLSDKDCEVLKNPAPVVNNYYNNADYRIIDREIPKASCEQVKPTPKRKIVKSQPKPKKACT